LPILDLLAPCDASGRLSAKKLLTSKQGTEGKTVTHTILLAVGIGAGFLVWLQGLAYGYFVVTPLDPGSGWSIYTVFFPLLNSAISICVSIGYCAKLVFGRKSRRNLKFAIAALVGPVVFVVGPMLLTGDDAFVYRMKSFSEDEYLRLAEDVQALRYERGIGELRGQGVYREGLVFVRESLVEAHPILAVSALEPVIWVDEDHVSFTWGVTRSGGYKAVILLNSDAPDGPESYALPSTQIYDSVIVMLLRSW